MATSQELASAPVGSIASGKDLAGDFKKHAAGFWFPVKRWRTDYLATHEIDFITRIRPPKEK